MDWVGTPSRGTPATGRTDGNDAWCRRDRRERARSPLSHSFHRGFGFLHSPVDFGDRLIQLRLAPFVRRRDELPIEFRPRETQRLERLQLLGIAYELAV